MKILILGASGMLGNAMLRVLSENTAHDVRGTVRSSASAALLPESLRGSLIMGVDVENLDQVARMLDQFRPDVVINCIGLIKQNAEADDPLSALPINAMLPHRLSRLASLIGARLVHFSTDCVFAGTKGGYTEDDQSDAYDLYGRSKYLGELHEPHTITVRTSIIGHELASARSLIGWFLGQAGSVKGFTRAIFSGLPTVEIAKIVRDCILPNKVISGVWHVSADPIAKFDLLQLVAEIYGKQIEIIADDSLVIDRTLDSTRFRLETGYVPPNWPELIRMMRDYR